MSFYYGTPWPYPCRLFAVNEHSSLPITKQQQQFSFCPAIYKSLLPNHLKNNTVWSSLEPGQYSRIWKVLTNHKNISHELSQFWPNSWIIWTYQTVAQLFIASAFIWVFVLSSFEFCFSQKSSLTMNWSWYHDEYTCTRVFCFINMYYTAYHLNDDMAWIFITSNSNWRFWWTEI